MQVPAAAPSTPHLRRRLRRGSRLCDACCLACLCLLLQPLPVDNASAKDPDAPTAFAVISDWGGIASAPFTSDGQMAVATALVEAGQSNGYQFVLSAGNNFLPTGLPPGPASSAASTERFQATWQGVYEGLPVPWYVTGGYADWMGNATAERAFTHAKPQPGVLSWQYPSLWHTVNVPVPPDFGTLQIVLLDTVTLAGALFKDPGDVEIPAGTPPPSPSGAAGGVGAGVGASATEAARRRRSRRLRDFDTSNANPPVSSLQWEWLEAFLSNSSAQWLIVVGNDPIWSAGSHGPSWELVDLLLPMLDGAGVALYISGRDPIAQHFKPSAEYPSLDCVGIGIGSSANASQAAALPSLALNPPGSLSWSYGGSPGFMDVSMGVEAGTGASMMSVSFYDDAGNLLHSFAKPNPRHTGRANPPGAGGRAPGESASDAALKGGAGVLVMLLVGLCGGVGYFVHLVHLPPEEEKKRVVVRAAGEALAVVKAWGAKAAEQGLQATKEAAAAAMRGERMPLLAPVAAGKARAQATHAL